MEKGEGQWCVVFGAVQNELLIRTVAPHGKRRLDDELISPKNERAMMDIVFEIKSHIDAHY